MKNHGFEIKLNEEVLCRAGFENQHSVLHCIANSVRRKQDSEEHLDFSVGGLDSDANRHVDWVNRTLKHGDKITIEVISGDFDPPVKVSVQKTEEFLLEQKIKYFLKLKEELKEHLIE
jgi:hypothetical protein